MNICSTSLCTSLVPFTKFCPEKSGFTEITTHKLKSSEQKFVSTLLTPQTKQIQLKEINKVCDSPHRKYLFRLEDCATKTPELYFSSDGVSNEIVEVMVLDSELLQPGICGAKEGDHPLVISGFRIVPEAPLRLISREPERRERKPRTLLIWPSSGFFPVRAA